MNQSVLHIGSAAFPLKHGLPFVDCMLIDGGVAFAVVNENEGW